MSVSSGFSEEVRALLEATIRKCIHRAGFMDVDLPCGFSVHMSSITAVVYLGETKSHTYNHTR
jgi:hypothetical protein